MDLDDLVNLSRAVVHKIEKTISRSHEEITWFLWLCKLHYSFIKDLSSGSVVKDHRLSWKMPTLDLIKLNILFTAANNRVLYHAVKLYEKGFEIRKLSGDDLNLIILDQINKLVDNDNISNLMVFSR